MTILTKKQSDFVEDCMEDLYFVQWDRFIKMFEDGCNKLKVYGWIAREKDSYKDFVVLEIRLDKLEADFLTSSEVYTEEIAAILSGSTQAHDTCKRVESMFKIDNCVKLKVED